MIEPIHKQRDADTQHIPIDTLQRIQRIVLEETQGGRTIIRNLVSIMNDDDPDGKPSHRLQSARILLRLGFEEAREALDSSGASGKQYPCPLAWGKIGMGVMCQHNRRMAHSPLSGHSALNTRR